MKVEIKSGIKSGKSDFVFFINFFVLKFVFFDIWVFIILFVFLYIVGINFKVIDIIIEILWIGNFIFFRGFNNIFRVFVILIGDVVRVRRFVVKMSSKSWIIKKIERIIFLLVIIRFNILSIGFFCVIKRLKIIVIRININIGFVLCKSMSGFIFESKSYRSIRINKNIYL